MYYLALDGGGTKLSGILFDGSYNILSHAYAQGTHRSVYPDKIIRKNITECYNTLFENFTEGIAIQKMYVICGNSKLYSEMLPENVSLNEVCILDEGVAGLYAGVGCRNGFVALSGTGSDVFFVKEGECISFLGGWGAILGDEGSGVWMSKRAMQIAISYEQGWGDKSTMFGDLVKEKYALSNLWDYVEYLYSTPAPFRRLAELLPIVAEAANAGDEAMRSVFEEGGIFVGRQMIAMLKRYPQEERRITVCGGAWKAHPLMWESFCREVKGCFCDAEISLPRFEHVMAGPMCLAVENSENIDEISRHIACKYSRFVWNYKEDLHNGCN